MSAIAESTDVVVEPRRGPRLGPKGLAAFTILIFAATLGIVAVAVLCFPEVIDEQRPVTILVDGYIAPEEVDASVSSAMIAQAAIARGMSFLYRPVWGFELGSPEHEEAARQWISDKPGPVLLYCRSGRRSTILWAQAAVERLGIDTVLAAAARAGVQAEEVLLVLEEQLDRVAA